MTPDQALDLLLQGMRKSPPKLATALRSVAPDASLAWFDARMRTALRGTPEASLTDDELAELYTKYAIDKFNLNDRGYIASVHPIELWMLNYLRQHPNASESELRIASQQARLTSYRWLFKTHHPVTQNRRIRHMVELQAYAAIGQSWRALGYPFEKLTPSFAAAIGASGDRPDALAQLIGIVANDGRMRSPQRIESLDFASGTPYETHFVHAPFAGTPAVSPQIIDVVHRLLRDVVLGGTGERLADGLPLGNGHTLDVYGKTGTGDQRFDVFAPGARLIESRKVNRTATFVFVIDNRFFGTLTAYVHEPYAARYTFTSAMAVQLLKSMAPALQPLLDPQAAPAAAGGAQPAAKSGPMQVTLKLKSPDPMLPYGLDQDGMAGDVVGPAGLAHPDSLGSTTNGAGPYMIDPKATILNSQYVYVKNPYYWDPSAQAWDKVVIKIISDGNSRMSALKTGQVQVAEGAATEAAEAEAAGLTIYSAPSAMLGMYIGDIDGKIVPALKDVRVRQALNFAIDRKGIADSLYGKYGKPTTQFVPEGIGGYVAKLEDVYPYDPKKAKALLAAAGFGDGFKFTLVEQPAVSSGDLLAQAMVANWKDIGVDVTLKPTDSFATYVPIMLSQKYPATTLTFQYSVQLTDTQQLVTNPALYNYMGFTDQKANELAEAQRKHNIDSPEGVAAAEASETYMVENAFLTPVVSVDALLFATKGVDGLKFSTYPWPDPTNWKPVK